MHALPRRIINEHKGWWVVWGGNGGHRWDLESQKPHRPSSYPKTIHFVVVFHRLALHVSFATVFGTYANNFAVRKRFMDNCECMCVYIHTLCVRILWKFTGFPAFHINMALEWAYRPVHVAFMHHLTNCNKISTTQLKTSSVRLWNHFFILFYSTYNRVELVFEIWTL